MGDYDATLLGAVAQAGVISREDLRTLYCSSDEADVAAERAAKFDARLTFLANLGFIGIEKDTVTYYGSL